MSERIWYLKRSTLFEQLTPEQLHRLESRSRMRTYPRKSPIYLPADAAGSVMVLASGRIKICNLTAEGKQAILAFIEPGEVFGELAIFAGGQREEYAEAIENSKVVLIPGEEVNLIMEEHPTVALRVTKLIGLRRRVIERRLKSLLFRSNRERLVHLLLELAEKYGKRTSEGVHLQIKLSHQDLAGVIGSTRETVTVVLGELQAEGLLTVGRRKIVLVNLERLAESIDQPVPTLMPG